MAELENHGELGKAALRAGMDRKTARKYRRLGKLPSELKEPRAYRTRKDPFAEDWPYVRGLLEDAPELEAKTVFEHLAARRREPYEEGQLRTLQRRFKLWRAQEGPPKEVFFAQAHRPGEALQTDFTWGTELGVTIFGVPFDHMLCNVVLPYSNWQAVTVSRSESLLALRRGLQTALFRLKGVPKFHQTDNSTAATHGARSKDGSFLPREEGGQKGRLFNEDYLALMRHFKLEPRTTGVGKKEQNGDVEALNGALKRRLKQHLLLRGSRDFESVEEYERWIQGVLDQANQLLRSAKLAEELAVMTPLAAQRLAEFTEERLRVTGWSTIRIKSNTYSVPSRLVGEQVTARVYEDRIEVLHSGVLQLSTERLLGIHHRRIDYRHVIDSLVRKPGAFPRYRFREDFFPTLAFRRAHDALHAELSEWHADLEYLRVLQLAAKTLESHVEQALLALLAEGAAPSLAAVKQLVDPPQAGAPSQEPLKVDLGSYDELLAEREEVVA